MNRTDGAGIKNIAALMRKSAKSIVLALLATAVSIFLTFLSPKVVSFAVDYVIGEESVSVPDFVMRMVDFFGGRDGLRNHIILLALAMVICSLLGGIAAFASQYFLSKGAESFTKRLRDRMLSHIMHLPFSWHNSNQTGNTIQICTSDTEQVKTFVSEQLIEILRTVLLIIIALTMMFPMNAKLTWIFLATIPVIAGYSAIFGRKIAVQFRNADETEGELMSFIQENLTGVRVVRAFGQERNEISKFEALNNRFADAWIDMGYTLGFFWGIGDFVSVMQVMLIICVGALYASRGELTLGNFMVFVSYANTLSWPIRELGHVLSELSKAGVSVDRINNILLSQPETDEGKHTVDLVDGDIEFKHVSFSYDSTPVLNDISFTVKKGSTFGILGSTGSGKSTITYLLNRLYELKDNSGEILVGGINVNNIGLNSLRENIGLVLQEPLLFSKTIAENISIAVPDVAPEEIKSAAKTADIDNDISAFSDGYETIVGERGVTLSGGQKQRIAMARTLIKKSPVMVFDDSMSAVDMETDARIREALKSGTGDATVIMISHRINTLMNCDKIIVLDNGKLIEQGSHDELVNANGLYKRVYDIQSGYVTTSEGGNHE